MSDEEMRKTVIREYTTDACSAVKISFVTALIHTMEYFDFEYKPDLAHQIFGPSEKIFGYKDLKINILYSQSNGNCFVRIIHAGIINNDDCDLVVDDIWSKLIPALPDDFCRNLYDFAEQQKAKEVYLRAFGIPKYQFICQTYEDQYSVFRAHLCSVNEDGFKQVHNRFQTLILWYIDGANLIDLNDSNWQIIYLYTYHGRRNGPPSVTGFCTVYKFYAHPNQVRARISQFIIFPPYRRCGVGVHFLRCVYNIIRDTIPNLKDITVEDPNRNFRIIKAINNVTSAFFSPAINKLKLEKLDNTDFVNELMSLFKFNQNESQLISDLVKYMCASAGGYNEIKEEVIRRLKQRFRREYTKTLKCYRDSIKFNRQQVSSQNFNRDFQEHLTEFLDTAATVASKLVDNMSLTKIE